MSVKAGRRLSRILILAGISASAGLLSACASNAADEASGVLSAAEKAAVEVAERAVLSKGTQAKGDVDLQSIEPHQWSDSSLGCPQRGMSYLQAITDGFVVKLLHAGKLHEVRVAGENAVICPMTVSGAPRQSPGASRVTNLGAMEKDAIADLAQRLDVAPEAIRVAGRIPQRWSDSTLGCDAPLAEPQASGVVPGFRLMLSYAGRLYSYHTDLKRVFACPPIEKD
jgi:hypothetical protein